MIGNGREFSSSMESAPEQNSNVLSDFGASFLHAGIQNPISGLTQIADHLIGTNVLPKVQIFESPDYAEFGSGRWYAQQFGGALGSIIPFFIASSWVRGFARPLESETAAVAISRNFSSKHMLSSPSVGAIAENALSGFVADSTMRPSEASEGNFWLARLKHGAVSAATFSTLTASNVGLRTLGQSSGILFKPFRNEISTAMLSGIPAGLINAETNALLTQNRLASGREIGESIYGMSIIGGSLSTLHYLGSRPDGISKPTETRVGRFARNSSASVSEAFANLNNSIDSLLERSSGPSFAMATAGSGQFSPRLAREFTGNVHPIRAAESGSGASHPDLSYISRTRQVLIDQLNTSRRGETGASDSHSGQFQTQLKFVQKRLRELTDNHIDRLDPDQISKLSESLKRIKRITGSLVKRSSHQYEQDTQALLTLSKDLKTLREAVDGVETLAPKSASKKAQPETLSTEQVAELRSNLRRNAVNDKSSEKLISVIEQHPAALQHVFSALSNRRFKIQEEAVGLLSDKLERSVPAWDANRFKGDASELYALKASQSVANLLHEHSMPWVILKSEKSSSADKAGLDAVLLNISTGQLIPIDFTTNRREKAGSYKYHWSWSPSDDGSVTWQQLTEKLNQSTASPLKSMTVSDPLVNSTLKALSFGQRDSYHELKTAMYLLEDNPHFVQSENAFRSFAAGIINALGYEKTNNSSNWNDKNQSSWTKIKGWLPELDR